MFSSKPKFDSNKCKVQLKMLITRLNLLASKKGNLAKAEKRKAAMLLRDDKEHNARILVEQIIRDDYLLESYDLIKQYTEMLLARFNILTTESELKLEIAGAVCALVYAGYLMGSEVAELKELHTLFTAKYGKAYTQEVVENKEKYINSRLLKILSMTEVPDPTVIDAYLTEIAKAYGVEFVARGGTAAQPVSATLGIALPAPGQPMPGSRPPDLVDLSSDGAGPSSSLPTPMEPTATPVAGVAAQPVTGVPLPMGGDVPAVFERQPSINTLGQYTVVLLKDSALGFGLSVDDRAAVTAIKDGTTAAEGRIAIGDAVVAIDGKEVTAEMTVKNLAADYDHGASATFTMRRGGAAAPPPQPPQPSLYPSLSGVMPPPNPSAAEVRDPDDELAARLAALQNS